MGGVTRDHALVVVAHALYEHRAGAFAAAIRETGDYDPARDERLLAQWVVLARSLRPNSDLDAARAVVDALERNGLLVE